MEENIALDGYIEIKEKKFVQMQRKRDAEMFNDIWYEGETFDQYSKGDLFDMKILFDERYGEKEREREQKRKGKEIHREYIDRL